MRFVQHGSSGPDSPIDTSPKGNRDMNGDLEARAARLQRVLEEIALKHSPAAFSSSLSPKTW
jgi:hypothetical protein